MATLAPLPQPSNLVRMPTAVVAAGSDSPSFRVSHRATYKHQYSNIYWQRLRILRPIVQARSDKRWRNLEGNPSWVKRVLDVEKSNLCYVIGTAYMEMPLKPNVMEAIARDNSIAPPPPLEKFYSPDDNVTLEDESGRILLVGDKLKDARLVTGVIVGVLGMEAQDGSFEVVDICTAGLTPQPYLEEERTEDGLMDVDKDADEWIAAISGLDIGSKSPSEAQIQMLVEYLAGEGGGIADQVAASQISRLIIAGNSLAPITEGLPENVNTPEEKKARKQGCDTSTFSVHPILNLSAMLFDLANSLPIHILPGDTDPSGGILPQQPFPRAMFGDASRYPTLICETNPTYLTLTSDVDESGQTEKSRQPITRTLLINSGQPLNDMFKYLPTPPNTRLSMLESTLRWRHMAPTAPDTLWCHPYSDGDPFLIQTTPDIYIVGGQKKFGTKIISEYEGTKMSGNLIARSRIVMVPSFARTGILVLINMRTLSVKCLNFSVRGMTNGGDKTEQTDEPVNAPSPTPQEPQSSIPKSMDSPKYI